MPIGEYFKGRGETVASSMQKKYGDRWKEVFYATANKTGMKPGGKHSNADKIDPRRKTK